MFLRIYTGEDGQSHFEELDPDKEPTIEWEKEHKAHSVTFRNVPPGHFQDWHCAPRRQYVIPLSGCMEIGIGDGKLIRFNPGDVLLADDLTGQGHTTRAVGGEPRTSVNIPID